VWDGKRVTKLRRGIPQGSPISPLLANFFLEDFDRELEKSGRKLIRYADDFLVLAKTQEDAAQALAESERLLAAEHLLLNPEKTRIIDFEHGFRFLGALFQGQAIWVPWKNDRVKGRILFMAPPLPPEMRARWETAPPRSAMEMALDRSGAIAMTARAGGKATAPAATARERRMAPVAFLYLMEQGAILRKAGDRFLVEKEDEVLLDLPYHKLENVLLFGNIQVTTQALAELLEKGVNLSLFSRQGQYRGSLAPPRGKNIELRVAQFERFRDGTRALELARAIVAAKIANGLAVLARYRARNEAGAAFDDRRKEIESTAAALAGAKSVAEVDGFEGAAARAYFDAVMQFNKSGMEWPGRRKHPAPDPLNALLSLGYTLVMHELTALLEGAGIDPYLGFLHQVDYGRPSLALDLMEAFRHPVVDRLTLTLVNRAMLTAEDFHSGGERPGVFLAPAAMRKYFGEYERWMLARGDAKETPDERASFRDLLKSEVEKLAVALREGKPFEPYRFDVQVSEAECNTSSVTI
jgi:CRISPR-associated protein Cas1